MATAIVIVHLGLVLFIAGGLPLIYLGHALDWEWIRHRPLRALHLAATVFVALEALVGIACPLTVWEDAVRGRASQTGFIERCVDRVLFYALPGWVFTAAYTAFAAAVLVTWFVVPPGKRVSS